MFTAVNTHNTSSLEHNSQTKSNKFANFSLEMPYKEDLIEKIDKFIPIGIVILTLFIAFVVLSYSLINLCNLYRNSFFCIHLCN